MEIEDKNDILVACSAVIVACAAKKKRKRRRMWAKPWLLLRDTKSAYNMILQEFRLGDRDSFRNFLRMNTETFDELMRLVYPALQKSQTRFPKPLSVEERLACTLRFLATGETYTSLQYQFRISKSAISIFVPEVCQVIYTVLKDKFLRCPPFLRPFFPRSFFGRLFVCSCSNNHCRLNCTTPAHFTMPI